MTPVRPMLCVIGDALLDVDWDGAVQRVCRDAPVPVLDTPAEQARPGGAALAASLAAASGARTTLVTALGTDNNARRLRTQLDRAGVTIVDLGIGGPTPVKLRLRAGGQPIARVDRGCSPILPPGRWSAAAAAAVEAADAFLVSDYGRGMAAWPGLTDVELLDGRPLVWDPHVDGPRPPEQTALATPNVTEAHNLAHHDGRAPERLSDVVALADELGRALGCTTAVTAGPLGAVVADGQAPPTIVPTTPVRGDVCGAGDRFAASAAVALAGGIEIIEAVEAAVEDARAFVAGGLGPSQPQAPSSPRPGRRAVVALRTRTDRNDAISAAAAVRRTGGTVVAAGGCFDVLHAGHVQLLERARRLGDHLVVCLNSDHSVRRLKGAHRPLNTVDDRAAVLRSLGCVDGVVTFDDDTPCRALEAVRPHLFVKGADYRGVDLAERDVMAGWGGQVVLLPLVSGHSTTRLIATAAAAGA